MAQTTSSGAFFRAPLFQTTGTKMANLKIDPYEVLTIIGTARTGPVQFEALRAALEGKRPFAAQIRLLLELVRRGRLTADDLVALANRDRRVQS